MLTQSFIYLFIERGEDHAETTRSTLQISKLSAACSLWL
nr:MAG TPA: hypothetical protein [Caudoviricetes sp.]